MGPGLAVRNWPDKSRERGQDMRQPVIAINNVSAVYGRGARQVQALRGVTLSVQPGEIFGLLGPNGAGKTTLLACVEGLHRPMQGSIQVAGLDVEQQPTAVKRKLGLQLQRTALLNDLTVSELLEVYAALYEVYLTQQQAADLLARFDLSAQRRVLARRLSGGQQQRLCLAIAIAHTPEIILLDEPTTGLDPHARRAVWDLIRQVNRMRLIPTVSLDVISLVASSCGYYRKQIEPCAAHEFAVHVATQRGLAQRRQHRHPPRAQPVAPMRERHCRGPRLPPRRGTDQTPYREQGYPGDRTWEEKPPTRLTFHVMRCPTTSPLFVSWPWLRHTWMLVRSS